VQALHSSRSSVLEPQRSKAPADFDAKRKQALGQFLTPETIGSFMASLFEAHPAKIRPLETSNLYTGILAGEMVAICREVSATTLSCGALEANAPSRINAFCP
jgi:hypothetical protein